MHNWNKIYLEWANKDMELQKGIWGWQGPINVVSGVGKEEASLQSSKRFSWKIHTGAKNSALGFMSYKLFYNLRVNVKFYCSQVKDFHGNSK